MSRLDIRERYDIYTNDPDSDFLGVIIKDGDWKFRPDNTLPISCSELTEILEKTKALNQRKEY